MTCQLTLTWFSVCSQGGSGLGMFARDQNGASALSERAVRIISFQQTLILDPNPL